MSEVIDISPGYLDFSLCFFQSCGHCWVFQICWHIECSTFTASWSKPLDESERGEWKSWLKAQHSENEDHGILSHHFMANRWGNNGNSTDFILGAPRSLQMVTAAMKLKDACSLEEKIWPTWIAYLKSRDITLPTNVCLVKAMVFPVVICMDVRVRL